MFNFIPNYNPFNTFQFTNSIKKNQWSMIETRRSVSSTSPSSITTVLDNEDDHCDRHLDSVIANLNTKYDEEDEVEQSVTNTKSNDYKSDEEDEQNDQVTIFQEGDENVENTPLTFKLDKIVNNSSPETKTINIKFKKDSKSNKKMNESDNTKDVLPVSSMPTPMIYISRNSSMTSLNSFDIKSVHSSVASEYSQVTSPANNKKSKDDDDANYSVDEDLDLIMPESPSAQHESSFLMTQRIKHKQQQIIYRQTAAAMMPNSTTAINETSILPNNLFPNDPKSFTYMQPINKCYTNSNFKTVIDTTTSDSTISNTWYNNQPTLIDQTNSKLVELNQNMKRLNINSTETNASTLSFLNSTTIKTTTTINNNIHTPPVKLTTTPKFLNCPQPVIAQFNSVPSVNNALMSASQAPMSVSYAFMKQANPLTLPSINQINTTASSTSTTTTAKQTLPKFLQMNSGLSTYNPILPTTLSTSSSSTSSSSSSQASVINQQQQHHQHQQHLQLSPTMSVMSNQDSETPHVYAIESRVNYNQRCETASAQLSPQESVCSRISELSMASSVRQPKRDFKALLSKLNSNNKRDLNDQTLSYDEDQPKVYLTCDDQSENNNSFNNTITQFNQAPQFKPFLFNRQFPIVQQTTNISSFDTMQHPNYLMNQSVSNLDQTNSPVVFNNEGSNSKYSSASSLPNDDDDENYSDKRRTILSKFNNLKQMNTPVVGSHQNNQSANDPEDDILENFINEMLPVIDNTDDNEANSITTVMVSTNSKKSMQNSESSLSLTSSISSTVSKHTNKQFSNVNNKSADLKSIKSQLSKSSSFKENKQMNLNTTVSVVTKSVSSSFKKPVNKRLSAENSTTLANQSKPKTVLTKNTNNTNSNNNSNQPKITVMTKFESVKPTSSTNSGPVVNMTKAAQLRAISNKKSTVTNPSKSTQLISKSGSNVPSVRQMLKTKDNVLSKISSLESNDLNNSTHLVEHHAPITSTTARRQSFSFGCSNNKINVSSSQIKSIAIKTDTNKLQTTRTKLNK